ncbi:MAG: DNA polymerase subunit beta [Bacteroidetes bacterium]|nr:MAG: DNA polymerase subunit beta [Bacteroidota bacterium]
MKEKGKILQILRKKKSILRNYGVKRIGLFGSYLKNEQNTESDIDILIDFFPEKETFDNFMKVCEILEDAFPAYKLDIVTKNGLSKYIGSYILKETEYA